MTQTPAAPSAPQFATAGLFLERLVTGDFDQLAAALEADVKLSALLPRGLKEWDGRDAVCGAFDQFFGGMDEYEVLDAEVGQVGQRLQMRWRLHVRGGRLGDSDFVVEQFCYADGGPTGRIQTMSMVCSGFCKEHADV
jgi:SnoaL-like domain